jgi:hypothetical protein
MECFRHERLQRLEPRGGDFHLAIAHREQPSLVTAKRALIQAAHTLGLAHHWITHQQQEGD